MRGIERERWGGGSKTEREKIEYTEGREKKQRRAGEMDSDRKGERLREMERFKVRKLKLGRTNLRPSPHLVLQRLEKLFPFFDYC